MDAYRIGIITEFVLHMGVWWLRDDGPHFTVITDLDIMRKSDFHV